MRDFVETLMNSPLRHVAIAVVAIGVCFLVKFIYLTSTRRPDAALRARLSNVYGAWVRRADYAGVAVCCCTLAVYGLGLAADNDWRPFAFFVGLGVATPALAMLVLAIAWRKQRPRFEAFRAYALIHDIPLFLPIAFMVPGVAGALAAVWSWLL